MNEPDLVLPSDDILPGQSTPEQSLDETWSLAKRNSGAIDAFGNPTDQVLRAQAFTPEAERSGFVDSQDHGILHAMGDSFKSSMVRTASGVLKSFGSTEAAKELDNILADRKDWRAPERQGLAGWLAYQGVNGLVTTLPTVAVGLATGGASTALQVASMWTASFAQMFGENYEKAMRDSGDMADPWTILGASWLNTGLQAGVEVGLGPQRWMSDSLGRAMIGGLTREGAKKAGLMAASGFMPRLPKLLAAGLEEGTEEALQLLSDDLTGKFLSGQDMSAASDYLQNFAAGAWGGILIGGGATAIDMVAKSRAKTAIDKLGARAPDQAMIDAVTSPHLDPSLLSDPMAKTEAQRQFMANEDGAFVAFGQTLRPELRGIVPMIRNLAYAMSAEDQGLSKPSDFITALRVAFVNESDLSAVSENPEDPSQLSEFATRMNTAKNDGERLQVMRETFKGFDRMVQSAGQIIELKKRKEFNDQLQKSNSQGVAPLDDVNRSRFASVLSEVASKVQLTEAEQGKQIPRASLSDLLDSDQLSIESLRAVVRHGGIGGVKIGSKTYRAALNTDFSLSFEPETEPSVAAKDPAADTTSLLGKAMDPKNADGLRSSQTEIDIIKEQIRGQDLARQRELLDLLDSMDGLLTVDEKIERKAQRTTARSRLAWMEDKVVQLRGTLVANAEQREARDAEIAKLQYEIAKDRRVAGPRTPAQRLLLLPEGKPRPVMPTELPDLDAMDSDQLLQYAQTAGHPTTFMSGGVEIQKPTSAIRAELKGVPWVADSITPVTAPAQTGTAPAPSFAKQQVMPEKMPMTNEEIKDTPAYQAFLANGRSNAQAIGDTRQYYAEQFYNQSQQGGTTGAEGARGMPGESAPLFEKEAKKEGSVWDVSGAYFRDSRLAVFFADANTETVMHEWFHHLSTSGLLPTKYADLFKRHWSHDAKGRTMAEIRRDLESRGETISDEDLAKMVKWTDVSEENAVREFLLFVRNGKIVDPQLRGAFDEIRNTFATVHQRVTAEYFNTDSGMLAEQKSSDGKVYYHGTADTIEKFKTNATTERDNSRLNGAIFFTSDPKMASAYSEAAGNMKKMSGKEGALNIIPVVLNMEKTATIEEFQKARDKSGDLLDRPEREVLLEAMRTARANNDRASYEEASAKLSVIEEKADIKTVLLSEGYDSVMFPDGVIAVIDPSIINSEITGGPMYSRKATIAAELDFGEASPLALKHGSRWKLATPEQKAAMTKQVSDIAIKEVIAATKLKMNAKHDGRGGWTNKGQTGRNPNFTTEVEGEEDQINRAMAMTGYVMSQTGIVGLTVGSGNDSSIQIQGKGGVALSRDEMADIHDALVKHPEIMGYLEFGHVEGDPRSMVIGLPGMTEENARKLSDLVIKTISESSKNDKTIIEIIVEPAISRYIENEWNKEGGKNGESYLDAIGNEGSSERNDAVRIASEVDSATDTALKGFLLERRGKSGSGKNEAGSYQGTAPKFDLSPVRDAGKIVEITHYSGEQGLELIDPAFAGTGIAGRELERQQAYPEIYQNRSYVYLGKHKKEGRLGPNKYTAKIDEGTLYDGITDKDDLYGRVWSYIRDSGEYGQANEKAFYTFVEKAVKDAGYAGLRYIKNEAVLFHPTKPGDTVTAATHGNKWGPDQRSGDLQRSQRAGNAVPGSGKRAASGLLREAPSSGQTIGLSPETEAELSGLFKPVTGETLGSIMGDGLYKTMRYRATFEQRVRTDQEVEALAKSVLTGVPVESGVVNPLWAKKNTKTAKDFVALGDAQRDLPEHAMVEIGRLHHGVLQFVTEHVGDIMHRMNDRNTFENAGLHYVAEKVNKTLATLKRPYGFNKENEENIIVGARSDGVPVTEYRKKLNDLLRNYADEHKKLPVFNEAQRVAQKAAVALGERNWWGAVDALEELKSHMGSSKEWKAYAHEGLSSKEVRSPLWSKKDGPRDRNGLNSQIHAIFEGDHQKASDFVKQQVQAATGRSILSMTEASDAELQAAVQAAQAQFGRGETPISDAVVRELTGFNMSAKELKIAHVDVYNLMIDKLEGMAPREKEGERIRNMAVEADTLADQQKMLHKMRPMRPNAAGGSEMLTGLLNSAKRGMQTAVKWTYGLYDMCKYLDDANEKVMANPASFTSLVWAKFRDANHAIARKYMPIEHEYAAKVTSGEFRKDSNEIITLPNGEKYSYNEMLVIYSLANGKSVKATDMEFIDKNEKKKLKPEYSNLASWIYSNLGSSDEVVAKGIQTANQIVGHINGNTELHRQALAEITWQNALGSKFFDEASAVHAKNVGGRPLAKLSGMYTPLVRISNDIHEADLASVFESVDGQQRTFQNLDGLREFHRRQGGKGGAIKLDYRGNFMRHIEAMINYTEKREHVANTLAMLGNGSLIDAMKDRFGEDDIVMSGLQTLVKREMRPDGKYSQFTVGDKALASVMQNVYSSVFPFNIMSLPTQLTSLSNGLAEAGMTPETMNNVRIHLWNLTKFVTRNFARVKSGEVAHILEGNDIYNEVTKWSPSLLRRFPVAEAETYRGNRNWLSRHVPGWGKLIDEGNLFMELGDMAAVLPTWKVLFDQNVKQLSMQNMDLTMDEVMQKAANQAYDSIVQSQNPSTVSEKNLLQTGPGLVKALIPFSGQTFVLWHNMMNDGVIPLIHALQDNQGAMGKTKGVAEVLLKKQMLTRLAGRFLIPAVLMGMVARRRPPEDLKEVMRDLAVYPFTALPVIGNVIWASMFLGWKSGGPIAFWESMGSETIDTLAKGTLFGGEGLEQQDYEKLARTGGLATGVPQAFIRIISNSIDVASHKDKNFDWEMVRKSLGLQPRG